MPAVLWSHRMCSEGYDMARLYLVAGVAVLLVSPTVTCDKDG